MWTASPWCCTGVTVATRIARAGFGYVTAATNYAGTVVRRAEGRLGRGDTGSPTGVTRTAHTAAAAIACAKAGIGRVSVTSKI